MKALLALNKSAEPEGLPFATRKLVHLRASQINGCSCLRRHAFEGAQAGRRKRRADLRGRGKARGALLIRTAERAALALTEMVTRLSDRERPGAGRYLGRGRATHDELALAASVVQIAAINAWNRINAATRQVAGQWGR